MHLLPAGEGLCNGLGPPPTPPRPDPNIAVRDEQDMKRCMTSRKNEMTATYAAKSTGDFSRSRSRWALAMFLPFSHQDTLMLHNFRSGVTHRRARDTRTSSRAQNNNKQDVLRRFPSGSLAHPAPCGTACQVLSGDSPRCLVRRMLLMLRPAC